MAFPNGNGNGKRLEHFAENSWAKIVTRYVVPVLLAIAGFFGALTLNDIRDDLKDTIKAFNENTTAVMRQIAAGDRSLERLDGRVNVSDQVNREQDRRLDGHGYRLDGHDNRFDNINRVPNFPRQP